MKKLIVLIVALFLSKISFSQYPNGIQTLGNDSNLVQAKGGFKGRIVIYSYADTTAANLERIRQYAGAMIFTTGANKLWYRNAAISAWVELGSSAGGVNIYNSNGSLTGNRVLQGGGYTLTFEEMSKLILGNADTIIIESNGQRMTFLGDTASFNSRVSYESNLGSTFTLHTLVDKNYVDSSAIAELSGVRDTAAAIYDSLALKFNGVTSDVKGLTVYNANMYNGFNSIAFNRNRPDTTVTIFKSSATHGADGYYLWGYSTDGFGSVSVLDTVTVDGTNLSASAASIGKGNGSRFVFSYIQNAEYDTVFFAKADGVTNVTTSAGYVVSATSGGGYSMLFPFGKTIKVNGDTLYMPGYGRLTVGLKTQSVYFKTYDNGGTWSFGGIIIDSTAVSNASPSELDWEIYSQGSTVATTKIVAFARDDYWTGRHHQIITTNGGSSFTRVGWAFGAVNEGPVSASFPCTTIKMNGVLYAILGVRNSTAFGGQSIRVFKTFNPESVSEWYGGASAPKPAVIYRAINTYKGESNDWGYPWPIITPTGDLKTIFYDMGVRWIKQTYVSKRTDIKVIDVLGSRVYDAYNDANQAVSSGTETTVLFPDPYLDSDYFYNTDSTRVEVPADGDYSIDAYVQIDTSSLGTYRSFKLYAVDYGSTYGTSPQYANYLLDKVVIQPSTSADFNYVHLHAVKKLVAGMEVRVTVTQDSGVSLNILNSVTNIGSDGSRLIIKKID